MWTTENRPRYNRDKLRYPSDLTLGGSRHDGYVGSLSVRPEGMRVI